MSHVWLCNEETGGVWACPEAAVEVMQLRGWVQCDAPETDDSHLYDRPQAPAEKPEPKAEPKGRKSAPKGDEGAAS